MTTENDSGLSYIAAMILLTILLAPICYGVMIEITNPIILDMNGKIADGEISSQTRDSMYGAIQFFNAVPSIVLLGLCAYGVLVAHNRGNLG